MSKIINNIKEKFSKRKSSEPTPKQTPASKTSAGGGTSAAPNEQSFSIQPHPAKTNDPADLQGPGQKGLRHGGPMDAFHARDPYVPNEQIRNNLPEPLSREELQVQQAALSSQVPGHGNQQGNLL